MPKEFPRCNALTRFRFACFGLFLPNATPGYETVRSAALALSIHRSMSLIHVDTVVSSSSIISKTSRRSRGEIVIIFG
jgi:hypothetical protein